MNIKGIDLLEFLPQYMRQDTTAQGIAYAINETLKEYLEHGCLTNHKTIQDEIKYAIKQKIIKQTDAKIDLIDI